jgi:hypothetical protein
MAISVVKEEPVMKSFVKDGNNGLLRCPSSISARKKGVKFVKPRRTRCSNGHRGAVAGQNSRGTFIEFITVRVARELVGSALNTASQTPLLVGMPQDGHKAVKVARAENDARVNESLSRYSASASWTLHRRMSVRVEQPLITMLCSGIVS